MAGLIVCVAIAAAGPAAAGAEPAKGRPANVSTPPSAHVEASNHFAFDLYGKLREEKKGENLFYSPTSISMALAMTYAGARGDTAKQMASVLHWKRDSAALHAGMADWIGHLNAIDQGQDFQLRVANRLWAQEGYKFLPEFLKVTREQYAAELGQVNFQTQTEAARQTINRWVEQQTAQKITNLIPPNVLESRTKLVLTNAIYFKGDWESPFKKRATADDDFKLTASERRRVSMMQQTEGFKFARLDGLRVLQMPYKGQQLAMVIVLPDEVDGLTKLEQELSPETWQKWTGKLAEKEVWVRLPRFKMTTEFGLNDALSSLGMPLAFKEGSADFSGMNGKTDLFISAALHKAFVDVNEEGTEAAAATAVVIAPTAAPIRDEPEKFHADHPFLFSIVDQRTKSILFVGRVMDPTK
jgi:serpin B